MNPTSLAKGRFYRMAQYKNKGIFFILGLIFSIGLALRLYGLGSRSLWFDEADIVLDSVKASDALKILKLYNPVIFYKIFIFYWRHADPYIHEWLLRVPSVIFAMAALFLLYKLTNLLFNNARIASISAFLLSVSPLHIYYSQELSAYSFLLFIILAAIYSLIKLAKSDNISWVLIYAVSNIISIYTHPIMWWAFLMQNIIVIVQINNFRRALKRVILGNLLIIFLCIPSLYAVFSGSGFLFKKSNFHFNRVSGWVPQPSLKSILVTFKNLSLGYNAPRFLYSGSIILYLALFIEGAIKISKKPNGAIVLMLISLPPAALFIIAKVAAFSYYVDRYFLPFLPFFCITVAYGIYELRKMSMRVTAIALIIIVSAISLNNYYRDILPGNIFEHVGIVPRQDSRGAAAYISESLEEGDALFHTCRNTALPFEYYFDFYFKKTAAIFKDYPQRLDNKQDILFYFPRDIRIRELIAKEGVESGNYSNAAGLYRYVLRNKDLRSAYVDLNRVKITNKRVWLVYSSWNPGWDELESLALEWMDENYTRESEREFRGITVYLYNKKDKG